MGAKIATAMNGDSSSTQRKPSETERSGPRRRKGRRWLKVALVVAVGLASFVGIVYVRALLTLESSTFSRAVIWVDADVDDFPKVSGATDQRTCGPVRL